MPSIRSRHVNPDAGDAVGRPHPETRGGSAIGTQRAVPEHRFSLDGVSLASYYSTGESLKAKHQATDAAVGRFPEWVLGLIDDVSPTRALDAGCGWGRFSVPFARRYAATSLTCLDMYPGMVATALRTMTAAELPARYVAAAIEAVPFCNDQFDLVLANHVLYHARCADAAATELARVLTADGTLIATTDSELVRVPLIEIHRRVLDDLDVDAPHETRSPFSLENGAAQLAGAFDHVATHLFEHVVHYDVDALVTVYVNSGRYRTAMTDESITASRRSQLASRFRVHAENWLADEGAIASPQRLCAFVCRGPRGLR